VGIDLADWNWKVVRKFVKRRFGQRLSWSSCLEYLHRLDFVLKRPKKRLVKPAAERRAAFVCEYALLRAAAPAIGAKLSFVDEAHFYADVDLRRKWVLRGEPALDDEAMQMLVTPAKGNLECSMQVGDGAVAADEQASPDQWGDAAGPALTGGPLPQFCCSPTGGVERLASERKHHAKCVAPQ
jgi:hypothetical protein